MARSGSQGLGAATALLAAATPAAPPGTQAGTCCGAAQIHGLAAPPLLRRVGLGLVSQGEDEGADEEDDPRYDEVAGDRVATRLGDPGDDDDHDRGQEDMTGRDAGQDAYRAASDRCS